MNEVLEDSQTGEVYVYDLKRTDTGAYVRDVNKETDYFQSIFLWHSWILEELQQLNANRSR